MRIDSLITARKEYKCSLEMEELTVQDKVIAEGMISKIDRLIVDYISNINEYQATTVGEVGQKNILINLNTII